MGQTGDDNTKLQNEPVTYSAHQDMSRIFSLPKNSNIINAYFNGWILFHMSNEQFQDKYIGTEGV